MKVHFLFFILLFCCNYCFSQNQLSSDTTFYNSGKIKSIKYKKDYQIIKIEYYNIEGELTKERVFDSQTMTELSSYFDKGTLKTKYSYYGNREKGIVTGYYESGKLRYTGTIIKGLKTGLWNWFLENGNRAHSKYYENDRSKVDSVFCDDGSLSCLVEHFYFKKDLEKRIYYNRWLKKTQESFLKDNKYDGKTIRYYGNGKVKFIGDYKDGKMFGERVFYNENGELLDGRITIYYDSANLDIDFNCFIKKVGDYKELEGTFIDGRPEGEIIIYNSKGEVVKNVHFENGKADGMTYFYESNEELLSTELYRNGKFIKEITDDKK